MTEELLHLVQGEEITGGGGTQYQIHEAFSVSQFPLQDNELEIVDEKEEGEDLNIARELFPSQEQCSQGKQNNYT